jgi:hypothetical protein
VRAYLLVAAVLLVPVSSHGQGVKSCADLKSEIAQKLDAKNTKGYSLEIVDKDKQVTDGQVVGSCERGTKKIVYHKAAVPAPQPATQAPAKQPSKH